MLLAAACIMLFFLAVDSATNKCQLLISSCVFVQLCMLILTQCYQPTQKSIAMHFSRLVNTLTLSYLFDAAHLPIKAV